MGQVIRMDSVERSGLPSSYEEVRVKAFRSALNALTALRECSGSERRIAIENWASGGLLLEDEADAIFDFYGWRRG